MNSKRLKQVTRQIMQFKVSVKEGFCTPIKEDIYRILEIDSDDTLEDLAEAILDSFDFDCDHCYGFYDNIKKYAKSKEIYELFTDLPDTETSDNTKGVYNTLIKSVFSPKKKMIFLFDYGDEWLFLVECLKSITSEKDSKYPHVIESVGKSPEQYPDYDE
jgi:hypothetical protein